MAAEEIAAYKEETRETQSFIAMKLNISTGKLSMLLKWRESGYKAQTPFLMDTQATSRAARSHAKAVLRNPSERDMALNDLSAEDQVEIARRIITKPSVQKAFAENTAAERDLTLASGAVWERVEQREEARHREAFPRDGHTSEMLTVTTRLNNARSAVEKSQRELQDILLNEHEQGVVLTAAERLLAACEIFVGWLKGGGSDGFDRAFAEEILREES